MNWLINWLRKNNGNLKTVTYAIMLSQFILMFFSLPILYYALIFIINILIFTFIKDYNEGKVLNKLFIMLGISLILCSLDITNEIIRGFGRIIRTEINVIMYMMFDIMIIALVSFLYFQNSEKKIEWIREKKLIKNNGKTDYSQNDIVICKSLDREREIKISYKSRFLHFLILGPTGSGKTSKILIPMIWQDINNSGCSVIVIEPKGDLVEMVYAMGKKINRDVVYFKPTEPDCPFYNPLDGREEIVIENMIKVFTMLTPDSKQYYQDITDKCLRNGIMLLKRLERAYYDEDTGVSDYPATLLTLNTLLQNANNKGREMVMKFMRIPARPSEQKQNEEIGAWFINDYYNEKSKIHENSSGIRNQISKITSNKYLKRILDPPTGHSDVNFDKIMAEKKCIAITTSQDLLDDLGKYLGYFLILNLQSAVFRRPGNEDTRSPVYLYIDEFQEYSNPGYGRMLTQGRSYRVSSVLATQGLDQLGMGSGSDGRRFVNLVLANARNQIIFPGLNVEDSRYFENLFGSDEVEEKVISESRQKFNMLYGIKGMNYPTESVRIQNVDKKRYTATELRELNDDEIGYRIIDGMKVCVPEIGKVEYIDSKLNSELKQIVNNHKINQQRKMEEFDRLEREEERKYNIKNIKKNSKPKENVMYQNRSEDYEDFVEDNLI